MTEFPEGWYDDPKDGGQERYWDGQAWTPDVRQKYAPGWYDDPKDEAQERYWDGQGWTHDVRQKNAAGWYDDPKRFGAQRYWDGSGWTDEQRFLTRLDDVYQPIAIRKKEQRLVVAGDVLTWGDDSIRWDDVTGFDSVTNLLNGRPASHIIKISGEDRKFDIGLTPRDPRAQEAFSTVIDQAHRLITPRILTDLFARADAGEVVEYEKVSLSPNGFAKRGKDPVPWSEYGGWRTQNAELTISRMKGDKPKVAVRAYTTHLGRWVLTALIDDYSKRFPAA